MNDSDRLEEIIFTIYEWYEWWKTHSDDAEPPGFVEIAKQYSPSLEWGIGEVDEKSS